MAPSRLVGVRYIDLLSQMRLLLKEPQLFLDHINDLRRDRRTVLSEEGRHDWRIDEFGAGTDRLLGINTAILQAGQQETVQFVADKTGTFEYYCSVGNHRQMGMRGNLIVEE